MGVSEKKVLILAKGTELNGRYVINNVIGTGGYASVWRASDKQLNRDVALKWLLKREIVPSEENRRRVLEEARKSSLLVHTNIVQIFDIIEAEGEPLMVMEYVDGRSLHEHLRAQVRKNEPLSFDEAISVLGGILSGVEFAHHKSICHRDLTPMNIILTSSGIPKIADFGIARFMPPAKAADSLELSRQGGTGNPDFMSPEQSRGEEADFYSDLFMVGIIGYLLLAGRHPFSHPSGLFSIRESIQDPDFLPDVPRPPSVLTQIQQRQFREYAAIVMRLLHRERSARFGSAREAIDAIDAVIPALECPSCGERVPEHHRFCGLCGASLETTLPSLDPRRESSRDYTQYVFDGQIYNKRKLVLAVVKKWSAISRPQSVDELIRAFPQGLKSGGLFVDVQVAKEIFARHGIQRHFLGNDETFIFPDSTEYALSNQWGKEGISEFIRRASVLGLEIHEA